MFLWFCVQRLVFLRPFRRFEIVYRVIPDDRATIEATLASLCDDESCAFVVTTGGTGPAPRDVTPEATEAVCDRLMPGYGEQMRAISLRFVPTAVLSRQTAGLRGASLIINLPGKPKAIRETIDEIFVSVPACISLLGGPWIETHDEVVKAFRVGKPPQAGTAKTAQVTIREQQ